MTADMMPFGAMPSDTSEFMVGSVLVNVVLFESTGALDPSTENWTPALIQDTKDKIASAMDWWSTLLDGENSVHHLDFQYNYQWADNPVPTKYEPIFRTADYFTLYVYDFLQRAGYSQTGDFQQDVKAFNNSERQIYGTNWSFTIFVVNSTNDSDDRFNLTGTYTGAFAYYGSLEVVPSGRPTSTYAHETGHIFYAFDEYLGGNSYTDKRGYFGAQDTNAYEGAPPGFVQEPSLMSTGQSLEDSFNNHTLPEATKEIIGWKDSDGDGVFDEYDVPQILTGVGQYDAAAQTYRFRGNATVDTLVNGNTVGLKNDITLARISRLEYQVDGGAWQSAATYDAYQVPIDVTIPLTSGWSQIQFRTIDAETGITSNVFSGTPTGPSSTATPGINGLAWNDADSDGVWDAGEAPLAGWSVKLVSPTDGQPISLKTRLDPDDYTENQLLNSILPGVHLKEEGTQAGSTWVIALSSNPNASAPRVFAGYQPNGTINPIWTNLRRMRIDFDTAQRSVSLIAVGGATAVDGEVNYGRIEAYDAQGNLIDRDTTGALLAGQTEKLSIARDQADIAYIVASSPFTAGVLFDRLELGPDTATVTDAQGRYTLPSLPAGPYRVAITPVAGWSPTQATYHDVTLAAGGTVAGSNYSFHFTAAGSPYYNTLNPYDVDKVNGVTQADLTALTTYVRTLGVGTLPTPSGPVTLFVDVNGDGRLDLADLVTLSNFVRSLAAGGSGNGGSSGGGGGGGEASATTTSESSPSSVWSAASAMSPTILAHAAADLLPHHLSLAAPAGSSSFDLFYAWLGQLAAPRTKPAPLLPT